MDSEYFFKEEGHIWKGKQGIYVLEQPLFSDWCDKHVERSGLSERTQERMKDIPLRVFKVGYARDSLYKRIRDYKTAYGLVPFKIHCLYQVDEKVFHKRANFALKTEQNLHQLFKDEGITAMHNTETDKLEGEWFFDLPFILGAMRSVRHIYTNDPLIKDVASKWLFDCDSEILTRSGTKSIPDSKIRSKLDLLIVAPRKQRTRKARTNQQLVSIEKGGDWVFEKKKTIS